MTSTKPKLIVLCCDGLYQRYLITRIAEEFELSGVVRHATPHAKGSLLSRVWRYRSPVGLLRYLKARKLIQKYEAQAQPVLENLFFVDGRPPMIPEGIPLIDVTNVNADQAVDFVKEHKPDGLCINGTNLLRQPMLDLIPKLRLGAINLHTGLSPYSRGGNCNLFMLLEGHPELVGLTVHHIDKGVDSGDIIFSARPELEPNDNYETIEAKTFRLGIDLMILAIKQIQAGQSQRVKQWKKGKLFLRKTGYVYSTHHRVQVNRLLKAGLISRYLSDKDSIDSSVRLIGETSGTGRAVI